MFKKKKPFLPNFNQKAPKRSINKFVFALERLNELFVMASCENSLTVTLV